MAKQGKVLPARRQRNEREDEGAILLRSAESIGRVIGSLQRQLDTARSRFGGEAHDNHKETAVPTTRKDRPKAETKTPARKPSSRSLKGRATTPSRTAKTTRTMKTTKAAKTAKPRGAVKAPRTRKDR